MKQVDRTQCIADLRAKLLSLVDSEHSLCEVAARKGILCKGFSQWSLEELQDRYAWLTKSRPHLTREGLEKIANVWQLARQEVFGTSLPCDTQAIEHDTCCGFDGFSDAQLARVHEEICGERVEIVAPPPIAAARSSPRRRGASCDRQRPLASSRSSAKTSRTGGEQLVAVQR